MEVWKGFDLFRRYGWMEVCEGVEIFEDVEGSVPRSVSVSESKREEKGSNPTTMN